MKRVKAKQLFIDFSIAGVLVYGAYKVYEHFHDKKYSEISTPKYATADYDKETEEVENEIQNDIPEQNSDVAENTEEETSVKEKIVNAGKKAVDKMKQAGSKMVDFIITHQAEIEAITSALSLVAAAFTVKSSYHKAFKENKKTPNLEKPRTNLIPKDIKLTENGGKLGFSYDYDNDYVYDFVNQLADLGEGSITNNSLGDNYITFELSPAEGAVA